MPRRSERIKRKMASAPAKEDTKSARSHSTERPKKIAKTQSTGAREKGNTAYISVSEGLCPTLKKERLATALRHYHEASRVAKTPNEKSSACKNIGMASWKMAPIVNSQGEGFEKVVFYYKEAMKHFKEAVTHSDDQSIEWTQNVMTSSIICWTEFLACLDHVSVATRIKCLHTSVNLLLDSLTQAQTYVEITEHLFHEGVGEMNKKNYKQSLSLLKDCYFPLNEARRLGSNCSSVNSEVRLMEEDIFIQMCVTESAKAIVTGDELLAKVVQDEEVLNMDMLWEVIDWYKNAIVLTREKDFEMEAIAHSRLGQVYDKVLHMKNRAKENFTRSLHLANLMVPRTFHNNDWHIAATFTLQRYQRAAVLEEEKMRKEERDKVKDEIEEDVKKLDAAFEKSTKIEFLVYVYKNYPPKRKNFKAKDIPKKPDMDQWKKLYRNAVIHYHPDKVDVDEHGLKWKVLSDEITKLLNRHYENLKGM